MQLILTSSLFQDWFVLSALLLLTIPFWSSGLFKLANISAALDEAEQLGLKPPLLVVIATILVQLAGSLLVVTGQAAWFGAGGLAVFTAWATLLAHPFWKQTDPGTRSRQRTVFLEHLGLIGGLMLAATVSELSR
jgi:transmembrane protein